MRTGICSWSVLAPKNMSVAQANVTSTPLLTGWLSTFLAALKLVKITQKYLFTNTLFTYVKLSILCPFYSYNKTNIQVMLTAGNLVLGGGSFIGDFERWMKKGSLLGNSKTC